MNSQHVNLSELGSRPARAMVSATARVRAVAAFAEVAAACLSLDDASNVLEATFGKVERNDKSRRRLEPTTQWIG